MIDYAEMMHAPVDAHSLTDDMSAWAQTVQGIANASVNVRVPRQTALGVQWESQPHSAVEYDCDARTITYQAGGIGNINSTERGSAARYNAGKPPIELIPLWMIAQSYRRMFVDGFVSDLQNDALHALHCLSQWQLFGRVEYLYNVFAMFGDGWDECAHVFGYGEKKYARHNWCKGMPWSAAMASAVRHLLKLLRGETHDSESTLPHIGHVYCNVVMLLYFVEEYPELDDTPTYFMGQVDPCDQPWRGDFA